MKRHCTIFCLLLLLICLFITGCQRGPKAQYHKYTDSFFDTFNTLTVVVGYTSDQEEFDKYFSIIQSRFEELHRLYDIYNSYEGINNIKTINDNAGIEPVKVEQEIIDLILFAKEWNEKTKGSTNIALGPVLKIWHDYRTEGSADPLNAKVPPMEELRQAEKYIDIDKVVVDTKNSTVYLKEKGMSIDVGAIAKGYAAEVVAQEVVKEGMVSGIISAGGNIRTIGKPLDGIRSSWGIGIQNPEQSILTTEDNLLDTVFVTDASVVSSGDYQRYYYVNGELIHHLIDPKTLMPAKHYRALTVVAQDSGVADFLSTALFLVPYEESYRLAQQFEGVEVIWAMPDGEVRITEGMKKILKSYGASGR